MSEMVTARKLLELIYTQFMSTKSGVVIVEGPAGETGEVGIEHGRLIHASWQGQEGEEAFWTLFRNPAITFRFVEHHRRRPANIHRPAELLLMDASLSLEVPPQDKPPASSGDSRKILRRTTMVRLQPEETAPNGVKCYVLDPGSHAVGRNPVCDIVIADAGVSGHHLTVDVVGGEVYIRDEASRNGTYINGVPITQPVLLSDGDRIDLGSVGLCYFRSQNGQPVLIEQSSANPSLSATGSIPRPS
ncbi:MAG: FHA domain-containing protein [Candidatus Methylacidiphilales bacterium]|nr:FHA domain-containing protein [Candidatus Methylacidiphilales bacterium]